MLHYFCRNILFIIILGGFLSVNKNKSFFKYLSVILTVAILLTSFPLDSLAAESKSSPEKQEAVAAMQPEAAPEANIIGEVTEKRDRSTKHFMKDDMSYEAVIYPMPVHYKKDGKWTDIDNSLVSKKDEQNTDVLENVENDYKVKLAKSTSSKKLVQIQNFMEHNKCSKVTG